MARRIRNAYAKWAIIVALFAIIAAEEGRSQTSVLFSDGVPQITPASSNFLATSFTATTTLAQDFALNTDGVLASVELWTIDTADGTVGKFTSLNYAIYTGASEPGNLIATGTGVNLRSQVDSSWSEPNPPNEAFRWIRLDQAFDLDSPVTLTANTKYWLAISASTDPLGTSAHAYWDIVDSAAPGSTCLIQGFPYDTQTWTALPGSRAFDLQGTAVPEPYPGIISGAIIALALRWLWNRKGLAR